MKTKSGIVLKIENNRAFIMESSGKIIDIKANPYWKKGDTITYSTSIIKVTPLITIAACLLVLLMGFYGGSYYMEPKYIISVDINPSLELTVNSFGRVTKIMAMNEDGEKVKASVSIINKTYQEAVTLLVESSVMLDYIDQGTDVTMSIVGENNSATQEMAQIITNAVEDTATASYYELQLECYQTDHEALEKAHHMGITAGKYYYVEKLADLGVDVETEGCMHQSISDLKQEIRQCEGNGHGNSGENSQGYGGNGNGKGNGHGHQHGKGEAHCENHSP